MRRPALLVCGISAALVVVLVLLLRWNTRRAGPGGGGEPLVLYCAAGIIKPVEDAVRAYEEEYGVHVQIEPGGSGSLLSKIRVKPDRPHLYLAADDWYTSEARRLGLARESIPVAHLRAVICVAKGNPKGVRGVEDLLRRDVRVSLANPEMASVGRTMKKRLAKAGRWEAIAAREDISYHATVNEIAQAVKIGASDAGIVWDPTAQQFDLDVIDVPVFREAEQTISICVLGRAPDSLQFARYLTARDRGLEHFRRHRFRPMEDADRWDEHPEVLFMAGAMLRPGILEAVKRFEEREGVTIRTVYNGCGILVSQMKAGARPEAYLSCDVSFLEMVRDRFGEAVLLSRNAMVLVVRKGNPKGVRDLESLARSDLTIGFAHPTHSALGALTERMLRKAGLHEKIRKSGGRIVETDTGHLLVNQILTGALDACIVYRTNIRSNPANLEKVEIVELDRREAIAVQPFAVAREGDHPYLLRRLFRMILEERDRFEELGFEWIPEK